MNNKETEKHRKLLKSNWGIISDIKTDQQKGLPMPDIQKPYNKDAKLIELIKPEDFKIGAIPFLKIANSRKSRRKFKTDVYMTIEELSFLLWTTQGVKESTKTNTKRTVPSAGARHPFETYLFISRVTGLEKGMYRYLPLEHKLCLLFTEDNLEEKMDEALGNQNWNSAVCFIWSTIPYRMEWRYSINSQKVILLDAGHVCQNLYLACESIEYATCAIGAYDQKKLDNVLRIDGLDEISVYAAPVGKYKE